MKISKERLKQLIQEELSIGIGLMPGGEAEHDEHPKDPHGYEGRMVKQNLWKIAEYAKEMYSLIEDDDDLEPWVEEKIAVASFMMDSVGHYLQYEMNTDSADASMSDDSIKGDHEDYEDHEDHEDMEDDEDNEEEFEFEPDDEDDYEIDGEEYEDEEEDEEEDVG